MLTINRKGFKVMPAITDNELAGIGLVAHNWSTLEFLLGIYIYNANGEKPFDTGKGQRASFLERARFLKREAVAQLDPKWAVRLTEILDDALAIKGQRDQVVHGLWGEKDGATGISTIKEDNKAGQDRRIDYGTLRGISLKIDSIGARLFELALESTAEAKSEFQTCSESWKAMLKRR